MAGLLEIVVILWKSIHRSMENNKEARVYTINKFASVLPEYLKVFKVSLATLVSRHLKVHLCSIHCSSVSRLALPCAVRGGASTRRGWWRPPVFPSAVACTPFQSLV